MRAEAGTSANTFRVHSFSYLRAAACLAIVLLHTVFCAVSLFPEEASATQALLSNIVVNNMMWAVPCFLMVSGALLLNPERPVTVKKCLTKYIPRMLIALVGVSMPIFWSGILLILLFSGILHWLPSSGRVSPLLQPSGGTGFFILDTIMQGNWAGLADVLVHLILPTLALSLYSMAIITRLTRSSMLETLNADYIRTARAKGLSKGSVNIKHALRNAMLPVSTVIGLQFGSLLGGALLTETVFAWPGIGKFAVDCVLKSDFPVVQGIVLLVAVIFVIMNLVVDIVYAYLDPRIKYGAKEEG